MSACPLLSASWAGVNEVPSLALRLAPAATSARTASVWPNWAARWRGVRASLVRRRVLAPWEIRYLTGEEDYRKSYAYTFIDRSYIISFYLTMSAYPLTLAMCSGVMPSSILSFTSAPRPT